MFATEKHKYCIYYKLINRFACRNTYVSDNDPEMKSKKKVLFLMIMDLQISRMQLIAIKEPTYLNKIGKNYYPLL